MNKSFHPGKLLRVKVSDRNRGYRIRDRRLCKKVFLLASVFIADRGGLIFLIAFTSNSILAKGVRKSCSQQDGN